MATKYYKFRGKLVYPQLVKPDDFAGVKRWKTGIVLDEESEKLFRESGLTLRKKDPSRTPDLPDELKGFYTFNRPVTKIINGEEVKFDPPKIEGWDGKTPIGNGTLAEIVVDVYDTRMGKGHRLRSVKILDLVPYEGKTEQVISSDNNKDEELDDEVPF